MFADKIKYIVILIIGFMFVVGCKKEQKTEKQDEPIVTVFGETLYQSDVAQVTPKGLAKKDSLLAAEAFVKRWINEQLVYQIAKKNISDKDKIDEMVENYRKTLVTYAYQEDLLKEHLSQKISDEELKKYYDKNKEKLLLSSNLVKGIYLKVPLKAAHKEELLKWYKSNSDEAKEHIEKYSLNNAVVYDYFYDKWKDFGEIATILPGSINDSRQFLEQHKTYEAQDSSYTYLLNIQEYKLAGSVPPFEYAKSQISNLIMNQRKEEFLQKFESDMYKKAVADKDIKYFNKEK